MRISKQFSSIRQRLSLFALLAVTVLLLVQAGTLVGPASAKFAVCPPGTTAAPGSTGYGVLEDTGMTGYGVDCVAGEAGGVTAEVKNHASVTTSATGSVSVSTSSDEGTAKVDVPAGALPGGSTVNVAAIADPAALKQEAPPALSRIDVVVPFTVNARTSSGALITGDFDQPVTLEFTVAQSSLPGGVDTRNLVVAFWSGSDWVLVDTTATLNADGSATLTAQVTHFTLFAALVMKPTVFERGAGGPFVMGIAGTNSPAALAAAQTELVRGIFAITPAGEWLWYIPGAPERVNTLAAAHLKPDSAVLLRFR